MKKSIIFASVLILIISGLGANALPDTKQKPYDKSVEISFSNPQLKDIDDNIDINLYEATSYLMNPGEYIVNRRAAAQNRSMLDSINNGGSTSVRTDRMERKLDAQIGLLTRIAQAAEGSNRQFNFETTPIVPTRNLTLHDAKA